MPFQILIALVDRDIFLQSFAIILNLARFDTVNIYYVRHGENKANITHEFSHRIVDYSLTERGTRQAIATARILEGKGICKLFSSPLKRATETAKIIGYNLKLENETVEEFREVNVGSLEGQPPTESNWTLYYKIMQDWSEGRVNSRFPGGENFLEMTSRAKQGLLKVVRSSGECQDVVVVGHGGILLAVLPQICENSKNYDLHDLENCSISILDLKEVENGILKGKVVSWRLCDHLKGDFLKDEN